MGLPGAPPFPPDVAERIASVLAATPRGNGSPRYVNRLVLETSPYLQQHAHNPVNWYPWGDEAFEEARRSGKPVFLSVGYSTCHWCHVMERESFEDEEIARTLNELYVPVKVDREERPDVDAVYMTAVQAITGGGGWPMSVWLTPEREPFYGGTYFPARDGDRGAQHGFLTILRAIAQIYRRDPNRVAESSRSLSDAVRGALGEGAAASASGLPGVEAIEEAVRFARSAFDRVHGGVRSAPKFPSSLPVRLLLRHHRRSRDPDSLHMATFTLERMAAGGIHDQLGGGFHRYSTDGRWLVPHFEKMLYDNALLALAYAEAYQVTGRQDLGRVARTTLDYVLREMTSPEGGFASATDADSEGVEGKTFVWTEAEIRRELGPDADRFATYYGVTAEGNFEGANVLHVPRPDDQEWKALADARAKLLAVRARRPAPFRDDKVLAGWNGLMIAALAFAGRVLAEPRYTAAASRAAALVLDRMRPGGRLMRVYKDGRAAVPGFLEDHAFVVQGLLELYEATFETRWLSEAIALAEETDRLFGDREHGGWFTAAVDHERLLAREKPTHDGAQPSGASVALLNALRLSTFTLDDRWRRTAEGALRWYAPLLQGQPMALGDMLLAVDFFTDAPREVVLLWPEGEPPPERFLEVLRRTFLPNRALAGATGDAGREALARIAPVAAGKQTLGNRPTAFVCGQGSCLLPAIEPDELAAQIAPVRPLHANEVPAEP